MQAHLTKPAQFKAVFRKEIRLRKAKTCMILTSTLTPYLTPYAALVHQGKGTQYAR